MPKSINPLARRKSASPFSTLPRKKPGSRKSSLSAKEDASDRLDDTGLTPSLAPAGVEQDIISLIRYTQGSAWDEIPERAAGMNSERISEVLRFRDGLPPIVSIAHVQAISKSSTNTERELARLVSQGVIRKVAIPGRGKGGAAVGDGVVLSEQWKQSVKRSTGVDDALRTKYFALMEASPTSATTPTSSLTIEETRTLVSSGFLTTPAALSTASLLAPLSSTSSIPSLSRAGSTGASGSFAAIGGQGAVHESGGGGSTLASQSTRPLAHHLQTQQMTFSLPATGAYLKLLTEARAHLLALLKQLSPRHKEAAMDLLKEKWDGNTLNDATSMAKRARGEWSGVLPGKTKRWREFYGLKFEWVLEECVGSGLMELFDTGSVGVAVRAR